MQERKKNILTDENTGKPFALCILYGVAAAAVLSLILIAIYSILCLTKSSLCSASKPVCMAVMLFSVFAGGWFCAAKYKQKGLVIGAAFGTIYMIIMAVMAVLVARASLFSSAGISMTGFGLVAGAAGGAVAIAFLKPSNTRK